MFSALKKERLRPIIFALIIIVCPHTSVIHFLPLFIRSSPEPFLAGTYIMLPLHPHIPHHHGIFSSSPFPSSFLIFYMMPRQPTTRPVRRTSQSNVRSRIAQRARQIRTAATNPPAATIVPRPSHALPSVSDPIHPSLLPLACRPLTPLAPSLRHTLRPLSEIICASCGALHWIEERAGNTSKRDPLFSIYYGEDKISLPSFLDPSESLYSLLHEATLSKLLILLMLMIIFSG